MSNIHQIENLLIENDKRIYSELLDVIVTAREKFILPYSNAHLNDLLKQVKDGDYSRVTNSLTFIESLTQEVCLTQYWNDPIVRLHNRNPIEYFKSIVEEIQLEESTNGLAGLVEPLKEFGMDKLFDSFKQIPHSMNFAELSKASPLFTELFKRSQHDNSMYAVLEDIYELSQEMRTNPAIYNGLCSLFKNSIPLDANVHNVESVIGFLDQTMPKTLINKSFTELYADNNKSEVQKIKTILKSSAFLCNLILLDMVPIN